MNFISYPQLARDISEWAKDLPRFDLVVGIDRSGMLPATMLAKAWDVPVEPLSKTWMENENERKVLVVDDSYNFGGAMRQAKSKVKGGSVRYGAVYVANDKGAAQLDYSFQILPHPRAFQWNLFHHDIMPSTCLDMDGVICEDVPTEYNDDGAKYRQFIRDVKPWNLPTVKVGAIVTGRLEKYRAITEEWLDRHGVLYDHLEMMPFGRPADRRAYGIGRFKAEHYANDGYRLFIEDAEDQARTIREQTGKPVLLISGKREWRIV